MRTPLQLVHALFWGIAAVAVTGGRSEPARAFPESLTSPLAARVPAPLRDTPTPEPPEDFLPPALSCERQLAQALAEHPLPGTPKLDKNRAVVLLYTKAEPTAFVRTPLPPAHSGAVSEAYRQLLATTGSPWSNLQRLWGVFSANPELGRSVLLREGYLYAEKPELAFALVDLVAAQQLFSDREIWIQRGERTLTAVRTKAGKYEYADGPERGQPVKLLLFDRIGTGTPAPPLHRDFRALRERLGFDRAKLVWLGEHAIVADLRYRSVWVRTLLRSQGAHLELECEAPSAEAASVVTAVRAEHERRKPVLSGLRSAIADGIADGLPFDEPLTEYGQQDGKLRPRWRMAYDAGQNDYVFNKDRYQVFGYAGQPLVPEVCVDFVFDTFERASGTWWRRRGAPRERVVGRLDFKTLEDQTMRRATSVVDYARAHPESFDFYEVPEADRVPFKFPRRLSDSLVSEADRFQVGDVVLIRGYAPWDKPWKPRIMHFHSFFVYETDPLTGQPIVLAGNPGRPLLQTWQFEAFRTPERSIWYRIRPHLAWLESIVAPKVDEPAFPSPAPLVVELRQPG